MAVRNISDIHQRVDDIVRKQKGVYLSPAQIDRALDDGQKQLFEELYKEFEKTKRVPEGLDKFRISGWFTSDSSGFVSYPSNLAHLLQLYTVAGSTIYEVREVTEDELPTALNSQLRKALATKPIGLPLSKADNTVGYQLYPQTTQLGTIVYLRSPSTPVYAYTQVGRVITYNSSGSTQIDFADPYVDKIISKALSYYGISMNETEIIQFGELKDKQT